MLNICVEIMKWLISYIVRKLLKVSLILLTFVIFNSYLNNLHDNRFKYWFKNCELKLIQQNNYQNLNQVFECVENKIDMKVLGTILFKEGSIF